ncbi:hypothetical protein AeRB84_012733 [Aphanomyces euteiches]|nr:hypothetical protein AeRB84_012733 [Aphanomyces euteiches]
MPLRLLAWWKDRGLLWMEKHRAMRVPEFGCVGDEYARGLARIARLAGWVATWSSRCFIVAKVLNGGDGANVNGMRIQTTKCFPQGGDGTMSFGAVANAKSVPRASIEDHKYIGVWYMHRTTLLHPEQPSILSPD